MDLKNWQDSVEKWRKIREKVKARTRFDDELGFEFVRVTSWCGYCEEFRTRDSGPCNACSLKVSGFCDTNRVSWSGHRSVFWRFVEIMWILSGKRLFKDDRYRKYSKKMLWKTADELSAKMLKRIQQDDPRKLKSPKPRKSRNPATK